MSEGYLTAARTGEAEYVDKKSRFISRVRSVADEAEARAFIEEIHRLIGQKLVRQIAAGQLHRRFQRFGADRDVVMCLQALAQTL